MEIPHNVYRMNDFVTNNMFDVKKYRLKLVDFMMLSKDYIEKSNFYK